MEPSEIKSQAMNWLTFGPPPRRVAGRWLKATEISPPVWYPPESEETYAEILAELEKLKSRRKMV